MFNPLIYLLITFLISPVIVEVSNEEIIDKTSRFSYSEILTPNNSTTKKIDAFFQSRYKLGAFSGTVLYSAHDTIYYKNAFGLANRKTKDTLNINSRFQLASISKTFTAFGIMLLEKEGKLSFQDSIRHFFPNFPYNNITIHQLLIHRSGLPNYMYAADKHWRDKENTTIDNCDVLDVFIGHEPLRYHKPGVRYNYNNTNYAILASIIETVSKKSYAQFMKESLFDKIGMFNTTVYDKSISFENNEPVIGYVNWRRRARNSYLNGVVGDKGIYSTVEDMNKFSLAIFENFFFTDEEMNIAYQLWNKELYNHDNYGYGWRVNMLSDSSKVVYHTGWWKGFRSYYIRSLKDEKTIVVLSNNSRTGKISSGKLMDLFDIKH